MHIEANDVLLTQREVLALVGYRSRTSLWRKIQQGNFPAPLKLPRGGLRWLKSQVLEWMRALPVRLS